MACFKPIRARYENGKIKFARNDSGNIDIPCGRCIGCRLDHSRQWAVRCVHEASLYDENCYLTLTYDNEHLPAGGSLQPDDFTKFMKRFRKSLGDHRIRYYMCGEYGDQLKRPHYHALIFNYDFPDKELWKVEKGQRHYVSRSLTDLWGNGICTIGAVTFESAAYVARYILKKQKGKNAKAHYSHTDKGTGEITGRVPEYTRMSLKSITGDGNGGIGSGWFKAFERDVFPSDEVVINGRRFKVPRYYDNLLQQRDPDLYVSVKAGRRERALANTDNSRERLAVREVCQEKKAERLIRSYEGGSDDS